jgi:hypothetical protein
MEPSLCPGRWWVPAACGTRPGEGEPGRPSQVAGMHGRERLAPSKPPSSELAAVRAGSVAATPTASVLGFEIGGDAVVLNDLTQLHLNLRRSRDVTDHPPGPARLIETSYVRAHCARRPKSTRWLRGPGDRKINGSAGRWLMTEAALSSAEHSLENQRVGGLQIRVATMCTSCRSATATTSARSAGRGRSVGGAPGVSRVIAQGIRVKNLDSIIPGAPADPS